MLHLPKTPTPFLIVTPLGLACQGLAQLFAQAGIVPLKKVKIRDWSHLSNHLRGALPQARQEAFLRVWLNHFPADQAEIWLLDDRSYAQTLRCKAQLRGQLPQLAFCLVPASRQRVHALYPFHLPEPEELHLHYAHLRSFQTVLNQTKGQYQKSPQLLN